jgi:hypothetical protein
MRPNPTLLAVMLVLASLAFVAGLSYGVKSNRAPLVPTPPWGTPFGPAGGTGGGAAGGFPGLPRGLTVDANGMLVVPDLKPEPGSVLLDWDTLLTFAYRQETGMANLPDALRALEGKRVTLVGFLMPLYSFTDIRQFAFVGSHWSCCFGRPAGLNGTLNVTLAADQKSLEQTLEPLRVVGTFRAREEKEAGFLLSVFSLDDAVVRTFD